MKQITELPKSCQECSFFATREDPDAWPYVCIMEEIETVIHEEGIPTDCPLHAVLQNWGGNDT